MNCEYKYNQYERLKKIKTFKMNDFKFNRLYISGIESYFNIKNDAELAKELGIKKETVYNWVNRGDKMNLKLLKNKFPGLDMNYFVTEGKEGRLLLESPIERIIKVIKIMNVSLDDVYKLTGIANGTFKNSENYFKTLEFSTVEKFLSVFSNVCREWLLTGKGEMFINDSTINEEKTPYNSSGLMQTEISDKISDLEIAYENLKMIMSKYKLTK